MGGLDLTLITGASGFVGSAVAKAFREFGLPGSCISSGIKPNNQHQFR